MADKYFNVQGETEDQLLDALKLAFSVTENMALAWEIDSEKGLVLYWTHQEKKGVYPFPFRMDAEQVFPIVVGFLQSEDTNILKLGEDDAPIEDDDDIWNELGWRVYNEKWGAINGKDYSFLAITPSYTSFGK